MKIEKTNFASQFLLGFIITSIFILSLKACGQIRIKIEVTDEPAKEAK